MSEQHLAVWSDTTSQTIAEPIKQHSCSKARNTSVGTQYNSSTLGTNIQPLSKEMMKIQSLSKETTNNQPLSKEIINIQPLSKEMMKIKPL